MPHKGPGRNERMITNKKKAKAKAKPKSKGKKGYKSGGMTYM